MKIQIISEHGYNEALRGIAASYKSDPIDMAPVAERLSGKGSGHDKFLESIQVWMEITAPRYWWQQFDTYRIGVTKQSESTMHTLMRDSLTQECFECPIHPPTLQRLIELQVAKDLEHIKNELPEGFLQCRMVCLNYKVILHIIKQRSRHLLREWQVFSQAITGLAHYDDLLQNRY
jgi:hypothetical protein